MDMSKDVLYKIFFSILMCMAVQGRLWSQDIALVPRPLNLQTTGEDQFEVTARTVISVENEEQKAVADYFALLFTHSAGFTPSVALDTDRADIIFRSDASLKAESYFLQVKKDGIQVKAADANGFFYAVQTLRLTLPSLIENRVTRPDTRWTIPVMTVSDGPRFPYRGLMLDISRYFLAKEEVLKIVDCMAMLKLNKLHLHLTDDNGWRLEIKKYPRLTEVGAWRVNREYQPFPDRRNPSPEEATPIGGYYTQEQMKEIIAYAQQRCVEIIPEIDMPAHSNAALAAYPELACPVVKKFIGVLPGLGGSNADIIYCAGNDKVFEFLQGVLDEVAELFPSEYIHIGGDEAWKTHWKECPQCQARMKQEKLDNEEDLQGYFMQRISKYVQEVKGKKVMGWDELTNSKLPEGVTIFGWQGFGNAALKAAAQGHPFIMTPARLLYLIRYQGPQWFEPLTYFGNNTLKDVYDYEPIQANWKPAYADLLMGVQGSMWTEFCMSPRDVTYQIFPRLAAVAEVAWSARDSKDWPAFLKGLDAYLRHLDAKGMVYAKSMYNIQHKVLPADGKLSVKLECERSDVEIRYTMDGSEPLASSPLYDKELLIDGDRLLQAVTFAGGKQMGKKLILPLHYNKATAKKLEGLPKEAAIILNGLRGSLRQTDFEWFTGEMSKPLTFTVDLLKKESFDECAVGCITNYGMAVHKPRSLKVEVSDDNKSFRQVGLRTYTDEAIFKEGNYIEDLKIEAPGTKARYVRFTLEMPGNCPADHVRPGQVSRVYIDEVIIK